MKYDQHFINGALGEINCVTSKMMRSSSLILGRAFLALQLHESFPIFFQSNLFYGILGIPPLNSTPNSHLSLSCLSLWITQMSLAASLLAPSCPSAPPCPQEPQTIVGSINLPPLSLTLFKLKCPIIASVTTVCPAPSALLDVTPWVPPSSQAACAAQESGAAAVKRFKRERNKSWCHHCFQTSQLLEKRGYNECMTSSWHSQGSPLCCLQP